MSASKITLIGFNAWCHDEGDDLFKLLTLPQGIAKDDLVNNILLRGGEFEVMYSDPSFLQQAIGVWSRKWYRTFDKWYKALLIEYSPLENYDRFEEWSDSESGEHSTESKRKLEGSIKTGSETATTTSNEQNDTSSTETKVSAYDTSTYQPSNTVDGTMGTTNSGSSHINTEGETETENEDKFTETRTNSTDGRHVGRTHGNIGVTTSQQMLSSELEIARFNLIDEITYIFLGEFIIPIY